MIVKIAFSLNDCTIRTYTMFYAEQLPTSMRHLGTTLTNKAVDNFTILIWVDKGKVKLMVTIDLGLHTHQR